MDNQNTDTGLQSKQWRSRLVLFLRWLAGGSIGCALGLFLFILSETGQPPLVGLVIFGQQQLFEDIMFFLWYDYFRSSDPIFLASMIAYSTIWVVLGALLLSGRKRQVKVGTILLILYFIVGFVWCAIRVVLYVSWAFRMMLT